MGHEVCIVKKNPMKHCELCQVYYFHLSCMGIVKGLCLSNLDTESLLFHCPKGKGCYVEENEDSLNLQFKDWVSNTCSDNSSCIVVLQALCSLHIF